MSSDAPAGSSVTEYVVKIPKVKNRRYHIMKFNKSLNIDFTKWTGATMEREDNARQFVRPEDEGPQTGAGSEFGKAAKEEARRKKLGIKAKKYREEDQPWILRTGGKTGKRFKGIREGGISANTAYYIFTQGADGAFEARPVDEWYNFHPVNRYKTLNAEEAEEQFEKRNTIMNYFSVMMKKRLKPDEEPENAESSDKKTKNKSRKGDDEMKVSEMDDWVNTDDSEGSDKEEDNDADKGKKKGKATKKKKKKGSDDDDEASEPEEDSDDGDGEGREVDYITDSSSSEEEADIKGVDQEDALRKLLSSGEDEEEEKKEDEDKKEDENPEEKKDEKKKKKKKKKKKEEIKAERASTDTSESSEAEVDPEAPSRAATPTKRKADDVPESASKKPKLETYSPGEGGITEDAVRRYLMRKPMTTVELCQKFKNKKTGLTRDQLVQTIALILKRVNPIKQHIKGKLYLSLKR